MVYADNDYKSGIMYYKSWYKNDRYDEYERELWISGFMKASVGPRNFFVKCEEELYDKIETFLTYTNMCGLNAD